MWLYTFRIEYIPQEVLNKIRDKSITHNIFRIQDDESIMFRFYCFHRIYACRKNFVRLHEFVFLELLLNKNDKIIYKYFKDKYGRRSKS